MTIEFRQAALEDAELLINIYNASFYSDYLRYGSCPGYGKTKEMMEESISKYPKYIILCDNEPVGSISCKKLEKGFNLFVPEYTNSTYDNPYFDKETAYKYYNEFMWEGRYAKIITLEQAIELLQS